MEADAALTIYEELYYESQKKIALQCIVSDDDSSMRALLKHSTNHSKGKLKAEIPEPEWLADPSHRTKVVAKPFFALANAPKSHSVCTKVDAIRVKKCYGYMIKNNCNKTIDEIKVASKAVIEHLFNNHEYCDSRWCRPKKLLEKNKKNEVSESNEERLKNIEIQRTKVSYYRSKTKDSTLYNQMNKSYLPFTTEERLKESLHNFSTQKNEAMNNSVAKYAPKTRTYSTSMSLTNRVMIAIGCCNLGFYLFWSRVYMILT